MWLNPEKIIDIVVKISDSIGDFNLSSGICPFNPEIFDADTDGVSDPPVQSHGFRDSLLAALPAAAAEIIERRDPATITDTLNFECAPVFSTDTSGYISLPKDFLKLGSFRMSDWEIPLFNPLPATSLTRRLQDTQYPGLKARPSKPEIFIVPSPHGFRLEFFGCLSRDAFPAVASYIPRPAINDENLMFLPSDIFNDLIQNLINIKS